jgi:ABC-type sugar transport system ATPase subunit
MSEPVLVLRGVGVAAGVRTPIDDVSFAVPAGATSVLLGPADSGASTTIKAIAGLARVSAGTIWVAGRDVTRARPGRRGVAIVFENAALLPHLSVCENVGYPLRVAGLDRAEIDRRVVEIAERLAFRHVLQEKPRAVNEGLRRRAGLARAIVREPAVYLLDRTFASLDDDLRGAAREAVAFLRERGSPTIVLPSGDAAEAARLADHLVVMEGGRVLQAGPAAAVRARPASLAVAERVAVPGLAYRDAIVLSAEPAGIALRLEDGPSLVLALDPTGIEVGERVTLAVPPARLVGEGWAGVPEEALLAFDSAGHAIAALGVTRD